LAGSEFTWWIKLFSHLVQAFFLALIAVLLPAAPLACAVLSGRASFLRKYLDTTKRSAKSLRALYRADVIARNLERLLGQFLMLQAPASAAVQGDCTHCGQCCLDRSCVFLDWADDGLSRCSIHNNWFWKLTSCGAYPIDAQSIAIYDCPSFKAVPIRVIRKIQAPAQQR
jgi:hypothetical protein